MPLLLHQFEFHRIPQMADEYKMKNVDALLAVATEPVHWEKLHEVHGMVPPASPTAPLLTLLLRAPPQAFPFPCESVCLCNASSLRPACQLHPARWVPSHPLPSLSALLNPNPHTSLLRPMLCCSACRWRTTFATLTHEENGISCSLLAMWWFH